MRTKLRKTARLASSVGIDLRTRGERRVSLVCGGFSSGLHTRVIADDGNGINWEAVRAKAKRAGLPSNTENDLKSSLFVDGFTTSQNVTDLSGRGVGMGALLEATRALGGEMTIDSTHGRGTRLRMNFPKDADTASNAPSAAA